MITEFKRYQITPEMLQVQMKELGESAHLDPGEKSLTSKLDDLSYVYEKLVIALHDKYVDAEDQRSEEHTSELQSRGHLVCRLLPEKKNNNKQSILIISRNYAL